MLTKYAGRSLKIPSFLYSMLNNFLLITHPVCDTQMQWLQSASDISRSLFVIIAEASAKPNRE